MKKRLMPLLYLLLATNPCFVEADPFTLIGHVASKVVPLVTAAVATGWGLIFKNRSDRKRKRKKARLREAEYCGRVNEASCWTTEQFKTRLACRGDLSEWGEIPASLLFEQYDYYQFPHFQTLLQEHSCFESSIKEIRKQINKGVDFNFPSKEAQKKFEQVVRDLACQAKSDRAYCEYQKKPSYVREPESNRYEYYEQQIYPLLSQQKETLCQRHQFYENEIIQIHGEYRQARVAKRHKALTAHIEDSDIWKEQPYALGAQTVQLLSDHAITTVGYQNFYGNQLQQVIHEEFIQILDTTAHVRYQAHVVEDVQGITTTLTLFAEAGRLHNHAGYIDKAISFSDFCWGVLDCVKGISKFGDDLALALSNGAKKGIKNLGYKMWHLDETLIQTANNLSRLVANWLSDIQKSNDRLNGDILALLEKRITPSQLWERDKKRFKEKCNHAAAMAYSAVTYVWENLEREKVLLAVEDGSEIATEMALTHVTCSVVGNLFSNASSGMAHMLHSGESMRHLGDIPLSGDGVATYVSLGSLSIAQEAAIATEAVGAVAVEVMDAASIILPPAFISVEEVADTGSQAVAVSGSPMPPNPDDLEKFEKWLELQKKFKVPIDGIEEIAPCIKDIELNRINHILQEKHAWGRLLVDPKDWDGVARIITKVMAEGKEVLENKAIKLYTKNLTINGEVVEVFYRKVSGIGIRIVNGWIKNVI